MQKIAEAVLLDHKDLKALPDHKVPKEQLGRKVQQDLKDLKEQQVPKEFRESKVYLEQQEQTVKRFQLQGKPLRFRTVIQLRFQLDQEEIPWINRMIKEELDLVEQSPQMLVLFKSTMVVQTQLRLK
jgi:hypothetical protein